MGPFSMDTLIRIAAVLASLWLAWAALMFASQRGMVFPGAGSRASPMPLQPHAQSVVLSGSQAPGQAILLRAVSERPAPAILFAHGNFEFARQNVAGFQPWVDAGLHVLLLEYPGYDDAPGAPTQATIDDLWLVAYDWLARQPGVDPRRIVGLGRSLGSGPTSSLAAKRPLAAVVLQSGFAATDLFAHDHLLPGFLVRDRWDNVAALRAYGGPVFASHGRHDEVIPRRHGEAIAALPNVRFEWLDCGHNDCPYLDPGYRERVLGFLEAHRVMER